MFMALPVSLCPANSEMLDLRFPIPLKATILLIGNFRLENLLAISSERFAQKYV